MSLPRLAEGAALSVTIYALPVDVEGETLHFWVKHVETGIVTDIGTATAVAKGADQSITGNTALLYEADGSHIGIYQLEIRTEDDGSNAFETLLPNDLTDDVIEFELTDVFSYPEPA